MGLSVVNSNSGQNSLSVQSGNSSSNNLQGGGSRVIQPTVSAQTLQPTVSSGYLQSASSPTNVTFHYHAAPSTRNSTASSTANNSAPANPGNPGVSTTPAGVLSPAQIAATQASITNNINQDQNNYNTANAINLANDKQQQLLEKAQQQNNIGGRTDAIQNAEQAAATGNQGLKAVLASLGALDGTGQVLAGRAVANSANTAIGTANETYTTNEENIKKAIDAYATQVNDRNAALLTALHMDNRNARTTGIQQEVNAAESVGDTPLIAQLLPQLAASTAPAQALQPASVLYNGAQVNAFAPANSLNVTAAPTQQSAALAPPLTAVNSPLKVTKTGPTPA